MGNGEGSPRAPCLGSWQPTPRRRPSLLPGGSMLSPLRREASVITTVSLRPVRDAQSREGVIYVISNRFPAAQLQSSATKTRPASHTGEMPSLVRVEHGIRARGVWCSSFNPSEGRAEFTGVGVGSVTGKLPFVCLALIDERGVVKRLHFWSEPIINKPSDSAAVYRYSAR